MTEHTHLLDALAPGHAALLHGLGRPVAYSEGVQLFAHGDEADRFWIITTGVVGLVPGVSGARAAAFETFGPGELLGWSWVVPPYRWRYGARALSEVTAREFPAPQVRDLCERRPDFGVALLRHVTEIIGTRLTAARGALLSAAHPHPPALPAELPQLPRVGAVMATSPVALGRSATRPEIVRALRDWRMTALPVLAGDGRVIGVVTDTDLLHRAEPTTAEELMTTPALTVHVDTPLQAAAEVMAQRRVRQLPVTDAEGRLSGMISRGDILAALLHPAPH